MNFGAINRTAVTSIPTRWVYSNPFSRPWASVSYGGSVKNPEFGEADDCVGSTIANRAIAVSAAEIGLGAPRSPDRPKSHAQGQCLLENGPWCALQLLRNLRSRVARFRKRLEVPHVVLRPPYNSSSTLRHECFLAYQRGRNHTDHRQWRQLADTFGAPHGCRHDTVNRRTEAPPQPCPLLG